MKVQTRRKLRNKITMITAISSVTVLAACSSAGSGDTQSDSTSIRVADYYTDEPSKSIISEMLDRCGSDAGVAIEREAVPSGDYLSKVLQQSSSKSLPDIQMLDAQDLPAIAETGALSPLDEREVSTSTIGDSVLSLGKSDGELYGLAPTVGTIVMFTNSDMLEEAGVSIPETWDDLKTAAAELTEGDRYGVAVTAKNTGEATYAYLPLLWSNGGSEDALDSQEAQEALQFEVDLVEDGSASSSVVQWGNSDVGDQFLNRNAAIAIMSATQMSKLNDDPELNYEITSIPVPELGDDHVAPIGGEVWTLPRTDDEDRQKKADEVLSCITSDETQLSLAESRLVVPANPDLDEEYLEKFPDLGSYVETVRDGRSRTALLEAEWPKTNQAIWEAVQNAITGEKSVSDALSDAAK